MKLRDAIAQRLPLAIRLAEDNDRPMAEAFVVPGGLAFADIFWNEGLGRHPFHLVEGEISGEGPWKVGAAEVRQIDHGDPRADEWNRWMAYKDTDAGRLATRGAAWDDLQESLDVAPF